jgi:hypothetical protein
LTRCKDPLLESLNNTRFSTHKIRTIALQTLISILQPMRFIPLHMRKNYTTLYPSYQKDPHSIVTILYQIEVKGEGQKAIQ